MPSVIIDYWNHRTRPERDPFVADIEGFFGKNGFPPGSRERLEGLLAVFPQGHSYSIAGSWATELLIQRPLKHTDIDIIRLQDNLYLDDATTPDEHCLGAVPFPQGYLARHCLAARYNGKEVLVMDPATQMLSKAIGELDPFLSIDALEQASALWAYARANAIDLDETARQVAEALEELTPRSFFRREEVDALVGALTKERLGDALQDLERAHRYIQKDFRHILDDPMDAPQTYRRMEAGSQYLNAKASAISK